MDVPGLTIYNLPQSPPHWDKIGIFYVSFCAAWTTVVFVAMAFCLYNRHLPALRVRGLPLAFGSVAFLHMYWIMAQIVYPIGATLPVVIAYDVQYFVMGMWFPLGIALFHAANLRFLRVAKLQKQFTNADLRRKRGCDGASSSWFCRIRNMGYTKKVMTLIVAGLVVQCLLCLGMWVACKKYHPTFGIPGTEIRGANIMEQLIDLGRGWEWWPSVLWQLIWTWMVAPVLIWRAWGIRDTLGWRVQTIGACVSGIHATPMFLIASYVPVFAKINMYFAPSQWIHLNTMFIEIFTVFIPAVQVVRIWLMSKRIANSSAKWESGSEATTIQVFGRSKSNGSSTGELFDKEQIYEYLDESFGDRLFTMSALNGVLDGCPTPLQEFSAHHDFSGENIAFLTRVSKWKASTGPELDEAQRMDLYSSALSIYIDFISPRDAEFPLNLSSQHLKDLEEIFEKAARTVCGEACIDPALPFFYEPPPSPRSESTEATLYPKYTGAIPDKFNPSIFDTVQSHIKDLVLNNTWPKFVVEMQSRRRRSVDSEGSGMTEKSNATTTSWVSRWVRSLS